MKLQRNVKTINYYDYLLKNKKFVNKPYYLLKWPVFSKNQVFTFETQGKVNSIRKKTIETVTIISGQRLCMSIEKEHSAIVIK
jgi:hypothetical protein